MSSIDPTGKAPEAQVSPEQSLETVIPSGEANRFASLVSGSDEGTTSSGSKDDSSPTDQEATSNGDTDSSRKADSKTSQRAGQGRHTGERDARHQDSEDARETHEPRRKTPRDAVEAAANPGDQILRGLMGNQQTTPSDAGAATTARVEGINDLAAALAQRVLVSDPRSGGEHEVRILLKGELFGGTEVRIGRIHGDLTVRLATPTAETAQQLQAHAAELQNALAGRLNATVKVSVDVQGGGAQQGGDGQPGGGDGRSRNRRQVVDEWDAQDGSDH
jgi:type III secretion system needle length determinant